ncbi:hypothetical protein [Paucibacter sp. DJ2R-2]|nr:hypothetical protein [Paucibacter sp. DJ2R-2]
MFYALSGLLLVPRPALWCRYGGGRSEAKASLSLAAVAAIP